jgi:hypothetical protein
VLDVGANLFHQRFQPIAALRRCPKE